MKKQNTISKSSAIKLSFLALLFIAVFALKATPNENSVHAASFESSQTLESEINGVDFEIETLLEAKDELEKKHVRKVEQLYQNYKKLSRLEKQLLRKSTKSAPIQTENLMELFAQEQSLANAYTDLSYQFDVQLQEIENKIALLELYKKNRIKSSKLKTRLRNKQAKHKKTYY